MSWGIPNRPNTYNSVGKPNRSEGAEGDIQVRQTNLGAELYGKIGGAWYGAPLTATEGNPVTRFGTKLSDHLSISSDSVDIYKNSAKIASFGETTTVADINLTGKIEITSTGSQNVMMGKWASTNPDVSGVDDNIVLGTEAGKDLEDGAQNNVIIGTKAGTSMTVGGFNVIMGYEAGEDATAAQFSTCVGFRAGLNITTTGDEVGSPGLNTLIGSNAGNTITTGKKNVCIGSGSNVSAVDAEFQIAIGKGVACTGDSDITVGAGSNTSSLNLDGSDTSWAAASSDERFKENITTSTAGLSFINDLRPVTYNWKKKKDTPSDTIYYEEGSDEPCLGHAYGTTLHGFIAQEVKTAIDYHSELKEGFKMWRQYDNGVQTVADGNLIPILTKAVQELSAKIDIMQTEINNLKTE